MNVLSEVMISEYLPKRSLAGFPKLGKKKRGKLQKHTLTHQMEHKNL